MIQSDNASIPLLSTKAKPKSKVGCIGLMVSIIFIGAILYYSFTNFNTGHTQRNENYFEEVVDEEDRKENKKKREYPDNMIEINYNVYDLMAFADSSGSNEPILPNTALWTEFHESMIIKAGYDPEEIRNDPETIINFHAHDDDEYVDDLDMEIVTIYDNDRRRLQNRQSRRRNLMRRAGMHCYTSFSFLDECPYPGTCAQAWYQGGEDRFAACGTHSEPGFFDSRGNRYAKIFGDDRTGCMGLWTDTNETMDVFTGARGSVYFEEDVDCFDQRPGVRTCYYHNGCEAWRETGSYLGIGARCCLLPDPASTWFTSWNTELVGGGAYIGKDHHRTTYYGTGATSGRCRSVNCDSESDGYDIALGCAGGQGSGWSKDTFSEQYAGQKQVGNTCHNQLSNDGFMNMYANCANINNGEHDLSCTQIYSDSAVMEKDDVYYSTTKCPPNRAMTDCNGYIDEQIDMCSAEPFTTTDVVYGEMLSGVECVAVGNSDKVRSQANCCRVTFNE